MRSFPALTFRTVPAVHRHDLFPLNFQSFHAFSARRMAIFLPNRREREERTGCAQSRISPGSQSVARGAARLKRAQSYALTHPQVNGPPRTHCVSSLCGKLPFNIAEGALRSARLHATKWAPRWPISKLQATKRHCRHSSSRGPVSTAALVPIA